METRPWHSFYPLNLAASTYYPARPLWTLLANPAQLYPDKLALIDAQGAAFTYAQLWERTKRAASLVLERIGADAGDERPRVLLLLPNIAEFVTYYYGALYADAIVVTASIALSPQELAAQIGDAEPTLVITQNKRAPVMNEALDLVSSKASVLIIEDVDIESFPEYRAPDISFDPKREIAVLQYTSGTTGSAKGAIMSHANLVSNAFQNARWFGWDENDITLSILPLYHTWGMCCCLNSTFAVGGGLVLADNDSPFDPKAVFRIVAKYRATILYGSATMFHRLLDAGHGWNSKLQTLRHVKAGAMLTQGNLKQRWDERFPHAPLQQGYGLTEASPECHNNPPQRFKKGTVGVPIQDTDCRIVDADDPSKVLEPNTAGEVLIKGPQVMLGYWRKPDATQATFHDGWLKTGDIGVMDEEGYLSIIDRKKDLIKFRGYSISANNVEECLLCHPAVKETVVVGKRDERDGEIPVAFVVLREPCADIAALLSEHCESRLASYERPREYRVIEEIPRNHVGKPLRRELRERLNGCA